MDGLRRYSAETSRLSIANVSSSAGNARIRSPGNRDSKALSLSTATPYEPNLSGVPAPTGLQLRVDGALTTLGPTGLDLGGGGRVAGTSAPGGLPTVPDDYDKRLRAVRRRGGLTQDALARGIGAAGKAVVYQ